MDFNELNKSTKTSRVHVGSQKNMYRVFQFDSPTFYITTQTVVKPISLLHKFTAIFLAQSIR